jgi:hypothetical protein
MIGTTEQSAAPPPPVDEEPPPVELLLATAVELLLAEPPPVELLLATAVELLLVSAAPPIPLADEEAAPPFPPVEEEVVDDVDDPVADSLSPSETTTTRPPHPRAGTKDTTSSAASLDTRFINRIPFG